MYKLIENLQRFNRKERFYLVGRALGNPAFILGEEFRLDLSKELNLQIPKNAFAAMDYHIDWISASLALTSGFTTTNKHDRYGRDKLKISGTQEDIDLLVGFENSEGVHLIMVEAKGVSHFNNNQWRSKINRLKAIFGSRHPTVFPHLVLASPREPQQLDLEGCDSWMLKDGKPYWVPLYLPSNLIAVIRCDINGNPSSNSEINGYWKVIEEKSFAISE